LLLLFGEEKENPLGEEKIPPLYKEKMKTSFSREYRNLLIINS
jgi:hypothetical protein